MVFLKPRIERIFTNGERLRRRTSLGGLLAKAAWIPSSEKWRCSARSRGARAPRVPSGVPRARPGEVRAIHDECFFKTTNRTNFHEWGAARGGAPGGLRLVEPPAGSLTDRRAGALHETFPCSQFSHKESKSYWSYLCLFAKFVLQMSLSGTSELAKLIRFLSE
jgi:hypothetical protein